MPSSLDELIASARSAKRAHRDVDVTLDRGIAEQVAALDRRIDTAQEQLREAITTAEAQLAEAKRDARLASTTPQQIEQARDERIVELTQQIDDLDEEREQLAAGTLVTFRFTQLPGQAWAELIARHPARVDVIIDRNYGYNYHAVARLAAAFSDTSGTVYSERVLPADDPDTEPALEPVSAEQWAEIFEILTGHEFERIASAIWDLNDYGPQQRIAAAGKASRAGSANRSQSPAPSESAHAE